MYGARRSCLAKRRLGFESSGDVASLEFVGVLLWALPWVLLWKNRSCFAKQGRGGRFSIQKAGIRGIMSDFKGYRAWTRLSEGVEVASFLSPTLPPAVSTNSVCFGSSRFVVVEAGARDASERVLFIKSLEARIARGDELMALVLSHHHIDHGHFARELCDHFSLPLWGHRASQRPHLPAFDRCLEDGDLIELGDEQGLEVMHTPGHAAGHLVLLHRPSGWGYAGDMVAGTGTILIDPDDGGDMRAYLCSLSQMGERCVEKRDGMDETNSLDHSSPPHAIDGALEPNDGRPGENAAREGESGSPVGARASIRGLIPSHGPCIENPLAWINHYIEHRLAREQRVWAALGEEWRDLKTLVASAYADKPPSIWPMAKMALRAHLQKLVEEGRAQQHERGVEGLWRRN